MIETCVEHSIGCYAMEEGDVGVGPVPSPPHGCSEGVCASAEDRLVVIPGDLTFAALDV